MKFIALATFICSTLFGQINQDKPLAKVIENIGKKAADQEEVDFEKMLLIIHEEFLSSISNPHSVDSLYSSLIKDVASNSSLQTSLDALMEEFDGIENSLLDLVEMYSMEPASLRLEEFYNTRGYFFSAQKFRTFFLVAFGVFPFDSGTDRERVLEVISESQSKQRIASVDKRAEEFRERLFDHYLQQQLHKIESICAVSKDEKLRKEKEHILEFSKEEDLITFFDSEFDLLPALIKDLLDSLDISTACHKNLNEILNDVEKALDEFLESMERIFLA